MEKSSLKKTSISTALKVGDKVMVIAGGNKNKRPNKGKVGKILRFVGAQRDRVVIEGVNLLVRHVRARQPGQESGIRSSEGSIHVSNVMYYPETLGRPVRLKRKVDADGKKQRGYLDPQSGEFVAV